MTLSNDEFLGSTGTACPSSAGAPRWARPVAQWLGVGLVHATIIGFILHMSPQAQLMLGGVIQASLILPQAAPMAAQPEPPSPPEPPKKRQLARQPTPVLAAAPRSAAPSTSFLVAESLAEPAPAGVAEPAPVGGAAGTPVSGPPQLIPPVFNANYLDNPAPNYPPTSRRLGEKGLVVLRVLVSTAGHAEHVEIKASSGFERLDLAAREAVASWRFVPARRGDEQVAAWVLVPVSFVMRVPS